MRKNSNGASSPVLSTAVELLSEFIAAAAIASTWYFLDRRHIDLPAVSTYAFKLTEWCLAHLYVFALIILFQGGVCVARHRPGPQEPQPGTLLNRMETIWFYTVIWTAPAIILFCIIGVLCVLSVGPIEIS